nr:hypothetical protein [Candidatus Sigynarchaeota archaeon]
MEHNLHPQVLFQQDMTRPQNPKRLAVTSIKFSPDGRFLSIVFSDGEFADADFKYRVVIWDLAKRRVIRDFPMDIRALWILYFTKDGYAFPSAQILRRFCLDGKEDQLLPWPSYLSPTIENWYGASTFSNDGRLYSKCVISSERTRMRSGFEGSKEYVADLAIIDVNSRKTISTLMLRHNVDSECDHHREMGPWLFSPENTKILEPTRFIGLSDGFLRVYWISDGNVTYIPRLLKDPSWSSDGRYLAGYVWTDPQPTPDWLPVETPSKLPASFEVYDVISPMMKTENEHGKLFSSRYDKSCKMPSSIATCVHHASIFPSSGGITGSVAYSPLHRMFVCPTRDGQFIGFRVDMWDGISLLDNPEQINYNLVFSPDGCTMVTFDKKTIVTVWNLSL